MVGRILAHFEVLEKLGAGGMGVVYKARDLQLRRIVALKLLPPDLVSDAERRRRFMQEARAASALNHPNIVTVHEIGEAEGVDYIAMEYVEGKTFGDWIQPGRPAPLKEVVRYAVQIAGALAKAHAAGIVHRDLKPANIIVNRDGLVKVLDFGLAKLVEPPSIESSAPTETNTIFTQAGVIAGTAAYMSPEQAEGKTVDARSDIFSFGAVLYEMATGRRAFQRESNIATMSAILNEEPQPIRETAPTVSATLEQIVNRCLRKDPGRRFQHMADLKVALEELQEESAPSMQARVSASPRKDRRRMLWIAGLIAAAGAAALALWLVVFRPSAPDDAALTAIPITSDPGFEQDASLSRDGKQVAYSWNGEKQDNFDIYVKIIGEPSQLPLTHDPARDFSPAWSPDGRSIAFLRKLPNDKAALMVTTALGGAERKITECKLSRDQFLVLSPAWSPDAKWLLISDGNPPEQTLGLTLVSVSNGEKQRLTSPAGMDSDAAFSPDGRSVVFVRTASFLVGDLYLLPLSADLKAKGDPVRLTTDNRVTSHPTWAPNGREVLYSSGSPTSSALWRVAVPGSAPPHRLSYAADDAFSPAVAPLGRRMVYTHSFSDPNVWKLPLEGPDQKAGVPVSIISSTRIDFFPQYSPDGKRITFASSRTGNLEIWVCNADGSNPVQVTSFNRSVGVAMPSWSPDGERLLFTSTASGRHEAYVIRASGGQPRRITDPPADMPVFPSWSADGQSIYFTSDRTGRPEIWKMPADGGQASQVTRNGGLAASESRDGTYIYYLKGGLWRMPSKGGDEARVLDSALLSFAVTTEGIYFVKPAVTGEIQFFRFSTRQVKKIFSSPRPVLPGFSLSPDGRSILYTQIDHEGSDLMLVENFR